MTRTSLLTRTPALLALLVVAMAATACNVNVTLGDGVEGSGDLVTQSYDFDDFDRIEVGSAFELDVTVGPDASVEVTTDDNIVEHLEVKQRGDRLDLRLDGVGFRSGTLRAKVTVPDLTSLEATGATDVLVVGIDTDDFDLDVSGASEVSLGGSADRAEIDVNGASDVDLDAFAIGDADVEINGASDVQMRSADAVSGQLNGASDLWVADDVSPNVTVQGASDLHRG